MNTTTNNEFEYTDTDANGLTDYDLHERFDEMLDDVYEDCPIAGLEYSTSRALKQVDPIAYRCGFHDWLDSEIQDGQIIEL